MRGGIPLLLVTDDAPGLQEERLSRRHVRCAALLGVNSGRGGPGVPREARYTATA